LTDTPNCPLRRAILIAGSQAELARSTGYTSQAVAQWVSRQRLSLPAAVAVERATEGQVQVLDLLPYLRTDREGSRV